MADTMQVYLVAWIFERGQLGLVQWIGSRRFDQQPSNPQNTPQICDSCYVLGERIVIVPCILLSMCLYRRLLRPFVIVDILLGQLDAYFG